jgi:subtilisin family serine protease
MKRIAFLLFLMLMVALSLSAVSAQAGPREYIILARGETSVPGAVRAQVLAAGGTITRDLSDLGMLVATSSNANFRQLIRSARAVVPNLKVQWLEPANVMALDVAANVANPPNTGDDDFYLDLQWGHDAVNAFEAWEDSLPGRGRGVRVAVIDSGIDADHPDITPNLNTSLSTSFVPGESPFVRPGLFFNHGTHVAGTIGGADNGFGIIGVAPEVELVAIKALSEFTGSGEFDWVVAAIRYAGLIRADVINMSLGAVLDSRGACDADGCYTAQDVKDIRDALARAVRYAQRRGATVIASAGNSAIDFDAWENRYLVDFPASVPGVLAISALAPVNWASDPANAYFDYPSSYTNGGRGFVDFGAPGGDFWYPGNENCTFTILGLPFTRPCWVFDGVFNAGTADGGLVRYYWSVGTSMAAPHASGVAAIIIGWNGGSMRHDLVFAEMRRLADYVGPSTTTYFGHGRVSAAWR